MAIPFTEYRTIGEIVRAHLLEHGTRLRAVVAFGALVAGGPPYDIELLEVVEDWPGMKQIEYQPTASLPLRGKLRIYFLTPEQFLDPDTIREAEERVWVKALLDRVAEDYDVQSEQPAGFARAALAQRRRLSTLPTPPSGSTRGLDPLRPSLVQN